MSQTISGTRTTVQTLSAGTPVVTVSGTVNAYGSVGTYSVPNGNNGSLTSTTFDAAVFGPGTGHFTLTNTGLIETHGTSTTNAFDAGVVLGAPVSIFNSGIVAGASGIAIFGTTGSSYIENSKQIEGSLGVGVVILGGGSGTVVNSGTIDGVKYGAVGLFGGGFINNEAGGHGIGDAGTRLQCRRGFPRRLGGCRHGWCPGVLGCRDGEQCPAAPGHGWYHVCHGHCS